MVPRTGFEPVIFALKGRCPGPLDERGLHAAFVAAVRLYLTAWCFVKKKTVGYCEMGNECAYYTMIQLCYVYWKA